MIVLRTVFFAQLLVMLLGFAILLVTSDGFQKLGLMFYLGIIALAVLPYALWQLIRYPARRRWAAATAATPFICLGTPLLFAWLNGGTAGRHHNASLIRAARILSRMASREHHRYSLGLATERRTL